MLFLFHSSSHGSFLYIALSDWVYCSISWPLSLSQKKNSYLIEVEILRKKTNKTPSPIIREIQICIWLESLDHLEGFFFLFSGKIGTNYFINLKIFKHLFLHKYIFCQMLNKVIISNWTLSTFSREPFNGTTQCFHGNLCAIYHLSIYQKSWEPAGQCFLGFVQIHTVQEKTENCRALKYWCLFKLC